MELDKAVVDHLSLALNSLIDNHTSEVLTSIREQLNLLGVGHCGSVTYTPNTDKPLFGILVMPVITDEYVNAFFIDGDIKPIDEYNVEIDSKLFDSQLNGAELAAALIYNIIHLIGTPAPIEQARNLLDQYLTENGTQIVFKNSVLYERLLQYGLIDTLIKLTNVLFVDLDAVSDPTLDTVGMVDDLKSAVHKIFNNLPDYENTASRMPKLIILDWTLQLYNDVAHGRIRGLKQLKRVADLTPSVLMKIKIANAIDSLNKIDTDSYMMESAYLTEGKKKGSLFSQIKYNGLRGIEDDFYEYMVRARNAETEDEVMYALKQINVRLSILDDYLRTEDLSEEDRKRWTETYIKYRDIRDELAKKKVYNKKRYGVFFDYNQLDHMDDEDY